MNAVGMYRFSRFLYLKKIPFLPKLTYYLTYLLTNSIVPFTASIGAESKLAYGGIGVVIHAKAIIGNRVLIGQNVTIGRQLKPETVPKIGDNVYIGPGARILGQITIGNNVIIGANAVVISDVPDNTIVGGVPAQVLKKVDCDIYLLLENIYAPASCDYEV